MADDEGHTIQEPSGKRAVLSKALTGERYRLGPTIASGGMGEVIEAEDVQVGRHVAIKRMLAKDPTDRAVARFIREAQIQGRLDHPSIVPVHEIGRDNDGRPFFAMKRLSGASLEDILASSALVARYSQQRLLRAFADVCLAVELAHTRGIVHRDLKPANIMLGDFGEVYVIDWGVAKLVGVTDDDSGDSNDDTKTLSGASIGTPGFMPPEQIRDASAVDARADIYALGCLLFEILAGVPLHPRGRSGLNSALAGADARPSKRALHRNIPLELDEVCVAATAIHAEDRRITAREIGERVQQFLDGDRDLERRAAVAREHLDVAREALAKLDNARAARSMSMNEMRLSASDIGTQVATEAARIEEEARATAMREAGRALALDPKLNDAANIISRLMLEPTRSLPRDVEAQIVAEAEESDRRHARITLFIVFAYIGFIPYLALARPWPYATVFGVVLALQLVMLRQESRSPRFRAPLAIIRNAVLIAILAHAFSPFLLGPALAALTTTALMFSRAFASRRAAIALVIAMAAAVLLPYVAEVVHLLPSSMELQPHGIFFYTNDVQSSVPVRIGGLVVFCVALIFAGAALAWRMLRAERASRNQLYVQAWQLKQLVS
ncbi:MAG: serine/threonine protein kinase [Myxococcota bacterium]|nr:serine/threonine protein kinase [Deltaproteobacteria bacterium]MDQ3334428.1 serine/threonine protein kinase [Myxococcota bacterium]